MITWQVIRDNSVTDSDVPEVTLQLIEDLIIEAGQVWSRYLDAARNITLTVNFGFIDEDNNTLAQAGSSFVRRGVTADGDPRFVIATAVEVATGFDPLSSPDIELEINLNNLSDLYFDPDISTADDIPSNLSDGFSVILHELGHGLGFLGFIETPDDLNDPDRTISSFDEFIRFDGTVPFFTGPNARAVFGGDVPLTEDSNNHVGNPDDPDDTLTGEGGDVLQAFSIRGVRESISALDIAILQDVGFPIRTASSASDELFGFEQNNDSIDGLAGNDSLSGLGGSDTLMGNSGNDTLDGGDGRDFILGGTGADVSAGGAGDDGLFAGEGDDGNDTLIGGAGNDTIGGAAGNDLAIGGGTNLFDNVDTGGVDISSSDTIFGGPGNDTLLGGGFDDANGNGRYDVGEENISVTGANTIYAGTEDDRVVGAAGNDTLGGGTGDDTLRGGDGDDTFYGGRGDDNDTGRNDVISGGNGNDTIFAGGGDDDIDGGVGDDVIFNGTGNDNARGNLGNDTLFGGPGDDILSGRGGDDTFAFFEGNGDDTITDFNLNDDTLDLNGTATDFTDLASVQVAASDVTQDGETGLLIDTGGGDSIFLIGLGLDDLSNINIIF
jgi:Ca2+-binding RTX toxin-like protein